MFQTHILAGQGRTGGHKLHSSIFRTTGQNFTRKRKKKSIIRTHRPGRSVRSVVGHQNKCNAVCTITFKRTFNYQMRLKKKLLWIKGCLLTARNHFWRSKTTQNQISARSHSHQPKNPWILKKPLIRLSTAILW